MFIPTVPHPRPLIELDKASVQWVQAQLQRGGYYTGPIDRVAGPQTLNALKTFKAENYLEYPGMIGSYTIKLLAALQAPSSISEQSAKPLPLNPAAGSKTGLSVNITVVGKVYVNQFIIPGIPLTWGEVTKNLTRIPNDKTIVENIFEVTKAFGTVRDKYGKPLTITSAYRPAHLGIGSRRSQHILGKALDIVPSDGEFGKLLSILKATPEINGIGLGQYKGFLHMDVRDGSRVIWRY